MSEYLKARGNPLMRQLAALEASRLQYDQVTNVMPQLSAEVSTMQWLYSVMNKGEGAMAVMNLNVAERVKGGGVEGVDDEGDYTMAPPRTRARIDNQYNMPVQSPNNRPTTKRKRITADGRVQVVVDDPVELNRRAAAGDPEAYDTIDQLQAARAENEAGPSKVNRPLFQTPTKKMTEEDEERLSGPDNDENEISATPFKA